MLLFIHDNNMPTFRYMLFLAWRYKVVAPLDYSAGCSIVLETVARLYFWHYAISLKAT